MVKVKIAPKPWRPTERNIEVLSAVCAVGTRKGAARALEDEDHPKGVSVRTVNQHMRILMARTNAVSVSQLCLIYRREIERYLLEDDGPDMDQAEGVADHTIEDLPPPLHVINGNGQ